MVDPYTVILVAACICGWFICGVINYVGYRALFGGNPANDMSSDFVVALGPVGTVMLIIMAGLIGFLSACKKIGNRLSGRSAS